MLLLCTLNKKTFLWTKGIIKFREVNYPAALFDPVAEPPVAEGSAAHIENKKCQDEKEDRQAS